jgi:hypothetical protein
MESIRKLARLPCGENRTKLAHLKKTREKYFELYKTSNLARHLTSCGIFSLLGYTVLYYKTLTDVIVAVSK